MLERVLASKGTQYCHQFERCCVKSAWRLFEAWALTVMQVHSVSDRKLQQGQLEDLDHLDQLQPNLLKMATVDVCQPTDMHLEQLLVSAARKQTCCCTLVIHDVGVE